LPLQAHSIQNPASSWDLRFVQITQRAAIAAKKSDLRANLGHAVGSAGFGGERTPLGGEAQQFGFVPFVQKSQRRGGLLKYKRSIQYPLYALDKTRLSSTN